MKKLVVLGLAVVLVMGLVAVASATPVTFSGSSGNLSASATFDVVGGNLVVTLTNTSTADVLVPADVLTAVFFTVSGNPTLTSVSAELAAGSTVVYDPDGQPAGGVVGGEWAYKNNLSGAPGGANSGISSAGFGLFGNPTFPGANLAPPAAIDGLQYGILSAGDDITTDNGGITNTGGLIKNSVVFILGNLPAGFVLADISNVSFQYGTALDEPNVSVPEPSTFLLLGAGLVGVGLLRRKFKK